MERQERYFEVERNIVMPDLHVVKVAPDGLGYGEGTISVKGRESEISPEILKLIEETINGPEILIPVSKDKNGNILDDDGCGDGRNVSRIFEGTEERNKSLVRAKVFGGGATMATATLIGLGRTNDKSLRATFSLGMEHMIDQKIGFGAHTDTHAHGANCGCGAIDKAPIIVSNALKFQAEIEASIQALGVSTEGLGDVMTAYGAFAKTMAAETYQGSDVMGEIIDNDKVVKELDDSHKEAVVVLNMVEGFSVDQEKIRKVSNNTAQAFAVDVWRVKQIADRLYANESQEVRNKAFLSELVYTLATAATLTGGDLPVHVVSQQFAVAA